MTLGRRDFLRWSAGAAGTAFIAPAGLQGAATAGRQPPLDSAALRDMPLAFPVSEYASRRARFMDQISDGIAVFLGSASGRQNNELRYFAGMTIPQAAHVLEISVTTANRHWAYARAWLHEELRDGEPFLID